MSILEDIVDTATDIITYTLILTYLSSDVSLYVPTTFTVSCCLQICASLEGASSADGGASLAPMTAVCLAHHTFRSIQLVSTIAISILLHFYVTVIPLLFFVTSNGHTVDHSTLA